MKRILTSLMILALLLTFDAVPVSAEHLSGHYWSLKTSEPQATSQERTFNLEFVTLSTEADDSIKVKLFQDGVLVGTKTTTNDYGDSGAFTVTVPADGQYEFFMTAENDTESKTSETQTVKVKGRDVRVISTDTTAEDGSAGGVQGASGDVAGDTNGDGVVDENDKPGQVDDEAATDETDEGVLGDEDKADSDNWMRAILASLAILAAAYYFFYYRAGRVNPFSRGEDR